MSALEEISKLPGYNDDGSIVVPMPRGRQFYFEPTATGSASSSM